jgi:phosphatidylglycerophosphate synthase
MNGRHYPPPPGTILAPSCAGVGAGWTRITSVGAVAIVAASAQFAKDGRRRGALFVATALGSFLLQQVLVARALTRRDDGEPDDLDAVDALTLSRGLGASIVAASALAGRRHRFSYAAKLAWPLAVIGSTLTDWIDGPLARRRGRGPTRLGRVLDLELDSWLTLATTFAGTRLGTLDAVCLITPSLRYFAMASPISYDDVHAVGKSERARNLGITQMALALASFAPFAGSATTRLARVASLILWPIHVIALAAALPRSSRSVLLPPAAR